MKIALAQIEVVPGQPSLNVSTMLEMIERARLQEAELIAFPEMCIGGYLLGDKWLENDTCTELMRYNEIIREASDGIAIAFGNVFIELEETILKESVKTGFHPNKDGRARKFNAIYVYQNKQPAAKLIDNDFLPEGILPKTLLPNYRFFDDERYFFSLQDIARDYGISLKKLLSPFSIVFKGVSTPIGFELCEDLWCEDYRQNYQSINPSKYLVENGAKLLINLSASPWTYGKNAARDRRVSFIANEIGKEFVPFLYVNCTGAQNNGKNIVTFDGGSTCYNQSGKPVIFSKTPYEQELIITDWKSLIKKPLIRSEKSKIAQKFDAIIHGIRHVDAIMGNNPISETHQKFCIGMSGGVDSSVVAALLTIAVGVKQTIGITMPSQFNSDETINIAENVAKKLGIEFLRIPIKQIADINIQLLLQHLKSFDSNLELEPILVENIQAKIRGTTILSNVAAQLHAFFTNNGNKVEIATGYATLYGDVGGAIAPIGDLTKTEVFQLAQFLNEEVFHTELIPNSLLPNKLYNFDIPPTAELKDAQIDPFKWGYHDALLEALVDYRKKTAAEIAQWYLEGTLHKNLGIPVELIMRWELDRPQLFIRDLEWFISKIQNNVFKRIQSPPIIILSKSAFGFDIRESQLPFIKSEKYKLLKKKILNLNSY